MKFYFRNIGPIRKAELELGDLTIIAGRNNTGKTYLVYTLYGFLQRWRGWPGIESYFLDEANPATINVGHVGMKLMEEGQYRCEINHANLHKDRQAAISMLARAFSYRQISNVFSSSRKNFENASIHVDFGDDFPQEPFVSKFESLKETHISIEYDGEHLIFSVKQHGKNLCIRPR